MSAIENVLKDQARFAAIEYMIADLYGLVYRQLGVTQDAIVARNKELRQNMKTWTFPELKDPAFSDLLASETEAAFEDLLLKIEKVSGRHTPPAG